MAAKIAKVINLFSISDSKISVGEQSPVSVETFSFDNLCMLTQSLWSEGQIAWTWNFHQMHLVIKYDYPKVEFSYPASFLFSLSIT